MPSSAFASAARSPLRGCVVRPCGYFSDMGALLTMARKGLTFLVGDGSNQMSPIHGRDLADFIMVAGEVDGVGTPRGTTTLRSYFERLAAHDPDA